MIKERIMAAGSFKIHCLAGMDETVVITKRGQPVVKLIPAETLTTSTIFSLAGVQLQAMSFRLRFRVKIGGTQ